MLRRAANVAFTVPVFVTLNDCIVSVARADASELGVAASPVENCERRVGPGGDRSPTDGPQSTSSRALVVASSAPHLNVIVGV